MSDTWYVPNYIVVDDEGRIVWSKSEESKYPFSEADITKAIQTLNYRLYYLCNKFVQPAVPGLPIPDKVAKLRLWAPSRMAAEKAADRANLEGRGKNVFWIEPA